MDNDDNEKKERKPVHGHHMLVRCTRGKQVHLALTGIFATFAIFMLIALVRTATKPHSPGAGWLGLGVALCACTAGLLAAAIYSRPVFVQRSLQAALHSTAAFIDCAVLYNGAATAEDNGAVFLAVLMILGHLLCVFLSLLPVDAPAGRLLLPWIDSILHKRPSGDAGLEQQPLTASEAPVQPSAPAEMMESPTGTAAMVAEAARAQHHREIRHKTMAIFHDWPAPEPFAARALHAFHSSSQSELSFTKGDALTILDCRGNWWQARNPDTGAIGFVPSNFVAVQQKGRVVADAVPAARSESTEPSAADELEVHAGQTIEVMEVHEKACLCRGVDGRIGSVPTECIELVK